MSSYVIFDKDDIEYEIISIFKSTPFDYNQVTGRPIKLDYLRLRDKLEARGLDVSYYAELLDAIFTRFIAHLPK